MSRSNQILSQRAKHFAETWYARPESGQDVDTLAHQVAAEFAKVAEEARVEERQRIATTLLKVIEP